MINVENKGGWYIPRYKIHQHLIHSKNEYQSLVILDITEFNGVMYYIVEIQNKKTWVYHREQQPCDLIEDNWVMCDNEKLIYCIEITEGYHGY
jgi:hypothetical protein